MKLIAISDIHGRTNFDKKVVTVMADADLVVIAGDITNFGGKDEAYQVLSEIKKINKNILGVSGNCDRPEVIEVLKSEGINLQDEIREVREIQFFGIGGSGYTPFNTPQEYSDNDFERIINKYIKRCKTGVLISHSPPLRTKVDRTLLGIHAGNKIIREFIEKYQPDLCICGHIHEARNTEKIGKTIIVNPGPFPKFYAMIV